MNAQQSSLYRDLEILMIWYIPIGGKLPKLQSLQNLGNNFQDNLISAMSACDMALNSSQMATRLDLISIAMSHLSQCNAVFRILHEYSNHNPGKAPLITNVQFANYLERMTSIKRQIGAWKKKTAASVND